MANQVDPKVQAISCGIVGLGCGVPILIVATMVLFGMLFPGKYADEIRAVEDSISFDKRTMSEFEAAPLNGGVAVCNSLGWAYWVKDGRVHACNGLAMGASPSVPLAPVGIGYAEVRAAVWPGQ